MRFKRKCKSFLFAFSGEIKLNMRVVVAIGLNKYPYVVLPVR
jgi:hypothetical protein